MKRLYFVCGLLLVLLLPLAGKSTAMMLVETGLDATSRTQSIAVEIDGETIYLGGISLRSLKQVMNNHDFSPLPLEERIRLYDEAHLALTWPAFKNLLVGFGEGSKLQGDTASSLFGIITDWATLSLVGSGMGMLVVDLMFIYPFRSSLQDEQFFSDSDQLVTLALDTMLVGGIAFGVSRIIQALLPVSYGARFNRNLRNTLGLTRKMEDRFSLDIGLVPATTMDHSLRMGVQFAARVDW